jgi:hypothetical protein
MVNIENGQCGLCNHFGEHKTEPQIFQIRSKKEAAENFTAACGHPRHEPLNLLVTANSGCTGFEPASARQ